MMLLEATDKKAASLGYSIVVLVYLIVSGSMDSRRPLLRGKCPALSQPLPTGTPHAPAS